MQNQDLSYKLNNHHIDLNFNKVAKNVKVSLEIFSFENVYTVFDGSFVNENNSFVSDYLVWGNTEKVNGKAKLQIIDEENKKIINSSVSLDKKIRSAKIRFDNLPLGKLISLTKGDVDIDEKGLLIRYPEGWRDLSNPLLVFEINSKKYLYIRCLDKTVNLKIFFVKKVDGLMRVDVVQEQNGTSLSNNFDVPSVEIGITSSKEEIFKTQEAFMKNTYNLDYFTKSRIVPSWLKDISLVVIMHMESFTGHIFHTYKSAFEDIKKLTEMIDAKRILVYFAGWEGRYYYKYGDYTPDNRLGGTEALKECVSKIKALGCKTMAMYGMNLANKNIPGVRKIYKKCEFESISGAKFHNGSVDWEGAHHYDFNELVNLNIANKKWSNYLFNQIKTATDKFGFDGAFLDIAACYINDKNNSLYEGVCDFCDRLRTIKPDFLVSGEAFYDGLAKAMPLFQSGHSDGFLHFHDRISENIFTPFAREFGHLCLGDPANGSTGVHELGQNTEWIVPFRKGVIPTISLVEDSLTSGIEKTKKIIEQSKRYIDEFCD